MKLDITVNHRNTDPETARRLDRIEQALDLILGKITRMAIDLSRLETEVSESNSVIQGAITLLNSIVQMLREAAAAETSAIQARVTAIADQLDAQQTALAVAIEANTPAAPAPTE